MKTRSLEIKYLVFATVKRISEMDAEWDELTESLDHYRQMRQWALELQHA